MTAKLMKLFISLFFMQMFLSVRVAFADTSPKPTMEFAFNYELTDEHVIIVSGILYECDQPDCSDASPLEDVGPQRLYCEPQSCRAIGYGFAPYHRLEIEFSDGVTRQSNIFETAGFDSKYTVTIRPDDLLVEGQFSLGVFPRTGTVLVGSCICALVSLSLIVGSVFFQARRPKKN